MARSSVSYQLCSQNHPTAAAHLTALESLVLSVVIVKIICSPDKRVDALGDSHENAARW